MSSISQRLATFCFTVAVYRALPFSLAVGMANFLLGWVPSKAQLFVTLLFLLLSAATYSLYPDHTYKKLLPACVVLGLIVLLTQFGVIRDRVFVWVIAALGVVGCLLAAVVSSFFGVRIHRPLQYSLMGVALLFPLAAAVTYMLGLHALLPFETWCLLSVAASAGNVFFNSRGHSIGVPFARIDTSWRGDREHSDDSPTSPRSPPRSPVLRPYAVPLAATAGGYRSRSLS